MTKKTLEDCAVCPVVSRCDAHVTDGSWHHREGVDPCQVIVGNDAGDAGTESESERIRLALNRGVCPDCGAPLVFGSRDPCEGDRYWCSSETCRAGPFLFPLHARVVSRPSLIDADLSQSINRARQVEAEIRRGIFADRQPFDAEKFVSDILGS